MVGDNFDPTHLMGSRFPKAQNIYKTDSSRNFLAGSETFAFIEYPRTIAADIIAKGGDCILCTKEN